MSKDHLFDAYRYTFPDCKSYSFYSDDDESVSFIESKDPVGCQHIPKKVVVSARLKFYVCTKCKADLGDA